MTIIVYTSHSFSEVEFSGRPQRANEKHFLIRKLSRCSLSVLWVFSPNICSLFALVVLFALSCTEPSPLLLPFCITTLFCHWFISPEIKVTLMMGSVQSRSFLPPAVQAAHQLNCTFSVCWRLWEWDLFINIPFYRWYSSIYLYVLFILCPSVHLNYVVYMQMIWNFCFRVYCASCTWWLICTPTPPSILWWWCFWWCWHIKWRTIYWCETNHLNLNAALVIFIFCCMQRGTLT